MAEKYTVESLLSQFMQSANLNYQQKIKMSGTGFVVGPKSLKRDVPDSVRCNLVHATNPIDSLDDLRRFSAAIRNVVKMADGTIAGILCELPISLDGSPPEPAVVLYFDQKFGGMRVFIAPMVGDVLVFQDLGVANPATSFLPPLFIAESYGPAVAEA